MTMHLEGPWLSKAGKKKGKIKFRSSEHAKKSRELKQEWEQKQKEWAALSPLYNKPAKKNTDWSYMQAMPVGRENTKISSRVTPGGNTAPKEVPEYTGSEMIGISIIHKSCLQPVFSEQSAKDAASMRR